MAERKNNGKLNLSQPKTEPLKRSKAQKKYFFLDDNLYRVMRQDRAGDLLTAWSYTDDKMRHFVLSDVKRNMKNAYSTSEVARLLNRSTVSIQNHVLDGAIEPPVKIHSKGVNKYGHPFSTMKWREEDIISMHDHLLSMGKPYKDGTGIKLPVRLPSRKELLAVMRNQPMFYMQTSDGEFIPIWQAKDHF